MLQRKQRKQDIYIFAFFSLGTPFANMDIRFGFYCHCGNFATQEERIFAYQSRVEDCKERIDDWALTVVRATGAKGRKRWLQ